MMADLQYFSEGVDMKFILTQINDCTAFFTWYEYEGNLKLICNCAKWNYPNLWFHEVILIQLNTKHVTYKMK